jgi:hypothetical protein
MRENVDQTRSKDTPGRTRISIPPALQGALLALIMALLPPAHGLGGAPPPGQPAQIRSQVRYDPQLSDPFFGSRKGTCSYKVPQDGNGAHANTREAARSDVKPDSRSKNTARCVSSLDFKHPIDSCHARLCDDGTIEVMIYGNYLSIPEYLKIQIENGGEFRSQYWFYSKVRRLGIDEHPIWTTRRQALMLDRRVYRKGDVIKGRIDFECVHEYTHPEIVTKYGKDPYSITVKGVFKTIIE